MNAGGLTIDEAVKLADSVEHWDKSGDFDIYKGKLKTSKPLLELSFEVYRHRDGGYAMAVDWKHKKLGIFLEGVDSKSLSKTYQKAEQMHSRDLCFLSPQTEGAMEIVVSALRQYIGRD